MSWERIRQLSGVLLAALALLFLARPGTAMAAEDLLATLDEVDRLWFGQQSTASVTMIVKTTRYERTLQLTYWVDGKDKTLIRIDAPAREKGNATLKIGPDIYNYLPKIDRTVKVSPALRSDSWMGSHFTNDDLLKATRFSGDYDAKLLSRTGQGLSEIWTIELTPKPRTPVPWSKVLMTLEKSSAIPSSQMFYDEKGALARTVTFSDVKELGGRRAPQTVRITPADKPEEHTELRYDSIDRAVKFEESFFSLSKLKHQ